MPRTISKQSNMAEVARYRQTSSCLSCLGIGTMASREAIRARNVALGCGRDEVKPAYCWDVGGSRERTPDRLDGRDG